MLSLCKIYVKIYNALSCGNTRAYLKNGHIQTFLLLLLTKSGIIICKTGLQISVMMNAFSDMYLITDKKRAPAYATALFLHN